MHKKKPLIPKIVTDVELLQEERSLLTKKLEDPSRIVTGQERFDARNRLAQVKRELNRLYAAMMADGKKIY